MGQAIVPLIAQHDDLQLAGVWLRDAKHAAGLGTGSDTLLSSDIHAVAAAADVLIDFSLPEATPAVVAAIRDVAIPLVIGVSGLTDAELQLLDEAAKSLAIVYDRNMSMGVALLESIVQHVAATLGTDFAVAVHETHHIHKLDAPSGTALKLGEAIAAARGDDAAAVRYEVERRGEVPGDHSVIFSSSTEQLTLSHSVTTRQVFAAGAIRAARWALTQTAGRYTMRDVLSEKIADSL